MKIQNLEQIRARNAYEASRGKTFPGAHDGEVVKKIPAQIRQNGLLGALAFAKENEQKKTGHADVFFAIITHLKTLNQLSQNVGNLDGLIDHLTKCDSGQLRAVTAEVMAYLNFLRRFARKKDSQGDRQ